MTPERRVFLEAGVVSLTRAEMRRGWHFCRDFDGLLTQGEMTDADGRCVFCGFDARRVPCDLALEQAQSQLLGLLNARVPRRYPRVRECGIDGCGAMLRAVLLYRPDAHPAWHTYCVGVMHLRDGEGL